MNTEVMQLFCVPIIPRGTPLPVTRSEGFITGCDGQERVEVTVYQGESHDPAENLRIGEFMITGLGEFPAGSDITCQFALDLDGLLEVTAVEKRTGLAKVVTIDTRDVNASFDLAEARRRMSGAFGDDDPEDAAAGPAPSSSDGVHEETTRAKDLRKRAARLMDGDLDDEDRADIQRLLAEIMAAIKSRDLETLRDRSNQIEDIIFYLEE